MEIFKTIFLSQPWLELSTSFNTRNISVFYHNTWWHCCMIEDTVIDLVVVIATLNHCHLNALLFLLCVLEHN